MPFILLVFKKTVNYHHCFCTSLKRTKEPKMFYPFNLFIPKLQLRIEGTNKAYLLSMDIANQKLNLSIVE